MAGMTPKVLIGFVSRYATRLRFPQLFLVTAALFVLDVLIPDLIPFADEVLLALATILLGSWQKQRSEGSTTRESPESSPES